MKTILEFIKNSNAWFYKSEKHLTNILRHIIIWMFLLSYIVAIYITKVQKSTLEYNIGFLIWMFIFILLAKYIAKGLFKWKQFTDNIENKKDPE